MSLMSDASTRVIRTVCGHDCPDMCSLLVSVEGARITRVKGDPEQPFTAGFVCTKVGREHELVHSAERLTTPLRRTGRKGHGSFEAVSWEAALDDITTRWKALISEQGPASIAGYCYSAHQGKINRQLPNGFFHALGTTQVLTGTVCDSNAVAGWDAALGPVGGADPLDIEHADVFIAWGADLVTTNVHLWARLQQFRKAGLRVIVIDPQKNRTGQEADWYLRIPPGADSALALSVMHVLVRDGLVDEHYIAQKTVGFDRLRTDVLPRFAPDVIAASIGIAADDIEKLAFEYGRAKAPFIRIGTGMSRNRNGADAVWAVALLPGVTGAYDRRGGGALMWTGDYGLNTGPISQPGGPKPLRIINHSHLGRDLAPDALRKIHSLFVAGNNPAVTCPDTARVRSALCREDLFTVVHDPFLSETARYADYVLPAALYLETEDLYSAYGAYFVQYGPGAVCPPGEAWCNAKLACELARRFDLTDPVFRRTTREHIESIVGSATGLAKGIDLDALFSGKPIHTPRRSIEQHFATPSGKLEFYSNGLESQGLSPMPEWLPEPSGTDGAWPLRLLTAPGFFQSHTVFSANGYLRQREGEPTVHLAPPDAERRGLRTGETVDAYNDLGSMTLLLEVDERVAPGIALIVGQRPSADAATGTVNLLCCDEINPLGAGATYQNTRLDIRRHQDGSRP